LRSGLPRTRLRDRSDAVRAPQDPSGCLGDDLELFADLLVGPERLVEVLPLQARVHDVPDPGAVLRDHRKDDRQGEHAFLEQPLAESLRDRGIAEHDRGDWGRTPPDIESQRDEPFLEVYRVRPQFLHMSRLRLKDIDRRGAGGRDGRWMRAAEQPRRRVVQGEIPQVVRSGYISTDDPEGR